MTSIERRNFLGLALATAVGNKLGFDSTALHLPAADKTFPRQDPALVQEMVRVSHSNLPRVKELLQSHPALAKAAMDWGFGDWEDALGAASHMGRGDIAEVLLANGARPTIFSAAMMGQLETVKAFIAGSPGCQRIFGPHGITLLSHAKAGVERARDVRAYLEQLGDADIAPPSVPLDPARRAVYAGTYSFGSAEDERLIVTAEGPAALSITRPGLPFARGLRHRGNHEFSPAGAEAVRVRFAVESDRASTIAVVDGETVVSGQRVS